MLDNRNPNDARLRSVDSEIETLVEEVEKRRSQISGTNDAGKSTAATKIEVATLESELGIQRELWLEALQVKERVVAEANRQRRMLIVMVTPIESDEPSFPRPIRDMPFVIMGLMALHMLSTISLSMIRDHLSG